MTVMVVVVTVAVVVMVALLMMMMKKKKKKKKMMMMMMMMALTMIDEHERAFLNSHCHPPESTGPLHSSHVAYVYKNQNLYNSPVTSQHFYQNLQLKCSATRHLQQAHTISYPKHWTT